MSYYRVMTHDLRSPLRGGEPIWDGALPYTLPAVELDTGPAECAPGWHACADMADALRIAGLWPTGHPSRVFACAPMGEVVTRGNKSRAASWELLRECCEREIEALGVGPMSERLLSPDDAIFAHELTREQMAWRKSLGRPTWDRDDVETALQTALSARGLRWGLRRYRATRDARDARAARDAWDAWDARDAWDAWAAWDARAARDARAAWDARDAWDAWAALTVYCAARRGWIKRQPGQLTSGLREAYASGLQIALPVAPDILGYVMTEVKP